SDRDWSSDVCSSDLHEHLPARMHRLFEASSHESTSGSIASRYSSLYHSITCAVLSELIAGVLPSASITLAPYDHATDQKVEWASAQWLIAIPTGFPCLLRIRPDFRSSSHVFGVSSPAFLKWAML